MDSRVSHADGSTDCRVPAGHQSTAPCQERRDASALDVQFGSRVRCLADRRSQCGCAIRRAGIPPEDPVGSWEPVLCPMDGGGGAVRGIFGEGLWALEGYWLGCGLFPGRYFGSLLEKFGRKI